MNEQLITMDMTSEQMSAVIIRNIVDGEVDPVKALSIVDAMERACADVKANAEVQAAWQEVIGREGKQGITTRGRTFTLAEAGVKYDYTVCGCQRWNELNEQITSMTEERKAIEAMLKTLVHPVADAETGEMLHLPERTSKTVIKSVKAK